MELRLNVPPQPPLLQERLEAALDAVQRRPDIVDLLSYGPTAGSMSDREAAAYWLRPLLGVIAADDIIVCAGGAALLAALVTTFAGPGDTIVAEALTYPGIRAVSRHFGMSLAGVAMDDEGIIPAALVDVCERLHPKILFCTPTIQNPTTATMSIARRAQIAQVAARFDLVIIEDDAYGLLPKEALPPIAMIASERTYYIASLSKCLSPGLRIAYCVGPRAAMTRIIESVRVVSLHAAPLSTAVATQWIQDGSAKAILHDIRSECVARQAIAREVLEGERIAARPEAPHLWLSLPGNDRPIPELGERLRGRGVAAKGDGFAVDGGHPQALRIGLGAAHSRDDLRARLQTLRSMVHDGGNGR